MSQRNTRHHNFKANRHEIQTDGSAVIYLRRRNGEEVPCYLDEADLPAALGHRHSWSMVSHGYARTRSGLLLHRLLLDPPPGLEVDHIDGDRLNNRRSNLRLVTRAKNSQNLQRPGRVTPRGITWRKDLGKWQVQASLNGKRHSGGCCTDIEEAHTAAVALRARLFTHANEDRHQLPPGP